MAEIHIDAIRVNVQGDAESARQLAGQLRGALAKAFAAHATELRGAHAGQLAELQLAAVPAGASADQLAARLAQAVVSAATSTPHGRS